MTAITLAEYCHMQLDTLLVEYEKREGGDPAEIQLAVPVEGTIAVVVRDAQGFTLEAAGGLKITETPETEYGGTPG